MEKKILIPAAQAIQALESLIVDPSKGLPEEVFLFLTRVTPMINVDLLVRDDRGQTLLTWRDDGYGPPGWHVPGGIIRYKERCEDRIRAVARHELGTQVSFQATPLSIQEVIHPTRENRGHFISMLYLCRLEGPLDKRLCFRPEHPEPGQWAWHARCPDNLIPVHEMYRPLISDVTVSAEGSPIL